ARCVRSAHCASRPHFQTTQRGEPLVDPEHDGEGRLRWRPELLREHRDCGGAVYGAGGRLEVAGQETDERRLAGAVRAYQPGPLATEGDGQIMDERAAVGQRVREIFGDDARIAGRRPALHADTLLSC